MNRLYLKCCILLFMLVSSNSAVFAQTQGLVISGNVADDKGIPIPGVTVVVVGTTYGSITNIDGQFRFSAPLENGTYDLQASYVGYTTQSLSLLVNSSQSNYNFDFSLSVDLLRLDEVVVTGTSVATSRKRLGNAISTLEAEEISGNGAVGVDQALSGKVAGALVLQNSGDPAGGISIRLRGASTISGSSDPLYIIDGVLVSNTSNELVDIGGTSQNRLVDINPSDIERIEIIKGAAAAAIYGSRASNGVVQIFTKRGTSGAPKVSFSSNVRINSLRKNI